MRRDKDGSTPGEEQALVAGPEAVVSVSASQLDLISTLQELDDLFFTVDDELTFTFANNRFLEAVGLAEDELIGHKMTDLYPSMEGTHVLDAYRKTLRTGEPNVFEGYWPQVDTWFLVRVTRSRAGLAVYGSPIDVRENDFSADLQASEERFRLLAQVTSDTVYDWKIEEDVLWWGGGYEALTGFAQSANPTGIGLWTKILHPDDIDRVEASLEAALEGEADEWSAAYRIVREDGRKVNVIDRGYIVRDENGRAVRMIGGMTDETERIRLDQHRLRVQRMEAIGKLTGGIAHDLNNILAPIIITATILLEDIEEMDGVEESTLHSDLEGIRSAADRGARMIRRLLAFTRGTGDRRRPLDLARGVSEALAIIHETFPKSIEVAFSHPEDLWLIESDPTQIQQIVTNLAINARDAIDGDGTISLLLQNVEIDTPPDDAIGQVEANRYVALSLRDDGAGMDETTLAQAFEPFYTTKEISKGTGLGLPSVLTIVENHHGFIRLESEPGEGTTVTIYFPASRSENAPSRPRMQTPRPELGDNEIIIVVDDEESVRESAARALIRNGYHVMQADGVDAALALLDRHPDVSLVLTDIMMPGRGGLELVDELEDRPGVRLLGWTGLGSHAAAAEMRDRGVRVLEKPLQMNELLAAVSSALS